MPSILVLSGGSSPSSGTAILSHHLVTRLRTTGHDVTATGVRDLPPAALLHGHSAHPAVRSAITRIEAADTLIITTAVQKTSCSALVTTLLTLVPAESWPGKLVLPVAIGRVPSHALVLTHALQPVAIRTARLLPVCFIREDRISPHTADHVITELHARPRQSGAAVRAAS